MMNMTLVSHQRGVSFLGLVFWGAILAFMGVVGAQVAPTFMEYQTVQKAVNKAKDGTTVQEVQTIFDKAAEVDRIKAISSKDLEISKGMGDKVKIRFAYQNEIHLLGPAYLVLKYSGESN